MFRLFRNLTKWQVLFIAIAAVLMYAIVELELMLPEYISKLIATVQDSGSKRDIWRNGGIMMAVCFSSMALSVVVSFFAAYVGTNFSKQIRNKIFDKIDDFSMQEINRFGTPSLITRTTSDVWQVQMLIAFGLQIIVRAPIMATLAIIKISDKGAEWTIATSVAVAVLLLSFLVVGLTILPKFKKMQVLTDRVTRVARENLTGLPVVRAYNAEKYQEEKFRKANHELTQTNIFTGAGFAILQPIIMLVMSGLSLSIYWIGAYLIDNATTIPEKARYAKNMIPFMMYAAQIVMSFMMIAMMFVIIPRAAVSAKRINEVLNLKLSIVGGNIMTGNGAQGEVEFKNVTFKYPDAQEAVVRGISFAAKKGQVIAIVGGTGSGKSTLVSLLPRFYDATGGEILIDGVNIREYTLESLRAKIGYIAQKATLFSQSIEKNVAFGVGENVDKDMVTRAVEIAQGGDFVTKMGGTDAEISQGGTNISGGQKQRLSIARAIYKKPEILIFDDSFSALDFKTDKNLRGAIRRETRDTTCFIVAQRIGTIMDADKIVVLNNGEVVGVGTHVELIKQCSIYKELAQSQLGGVK